MTYANAEAEPQSTTGPAWGSFPASFVDYNLLTGQSSYWYSSGGAADQKKVTTTDGFRVSFARPTATVSSATVGGVTGDRPTANGIATGLAPFAYQWERRSSGGQWQAVAGATGATYQLPALTPADAGGALRLRVKDGLGDAAVSPEIAVTFAKASVLSVTATSKAVKYGAKAQVAVKIAGRAGIAATGTVRLTVGSKIVASDTLNAAGAAVLTIPAKALVAGKHSATISYLGSAAYNAGAGKVTLQVTKAATKLTAKVKKTSIKAKARSVVTVAAKSAGSAATGKVRVTWKGTKGAAKGKSVTATATLKKGRANVKTAKLKKKGTYRVTVKYLGSANSSAKNAKAKTVKVT